MTEVQDRVAAEPTGVFERVPGKVEIHEAQPRETAVVQVSLPAAELPPAIHDGLCTVERVAREAAVGLAGPPFVRYLEWAPDHLVAEIGFPVLRPAPEVGEVHPARLPGGRLATIVHVGPYETVADTYAVLQDWMRTTGHGELGPMWEVYWSDPEAEPDPATWRTEILVPLD